MIGTRIICVAILSRTYIDWDGSTLMSCISEQTFLVWANALEIITTLHSTSKDAVLSWLKARVKNLLHLQIDFGLFVLDLGNWSALHTLSWCTYICIYLYTQICFSGKSITPPALSLDVVKVSHKRPCSGKNSRRNYSDPALKTTTVTCLQLSGHSQV